MFRALPDKSKAVSEMKETNKFLVRFTSHGNLKKRDIDKT